MQADRRRHWSAATVWRRFVAGATSYDVEGPLDDPRAPLTVYLESTCAKRLILTTKGAIVRYWLREGLLSSATAVFTLHGPATVHHCALLKRESELRGLPLLFYGDLDPMDLSTFGTLRAGGARWDFDPRNVAKLVYRGIDDGVLALAEQHFREASAAAGQSSTTLQPLMVRMGAEEQRHMTVLEQLLPDLEELVGPRCMGLLREGWKLEIEALHPRSFAPGFASKLMRVLRRPIPQTEPDEHKLVNRRSTTVGRGCSCIARDSASGKSSGERRCKGPGRPGLAARSAGRRKGT